MKALALLVLLAQPTSSPDLIGLAIPSDLGNLKHKQGACIAGSALGWKRSCEYSVGILEDSSGTPKFLFGSRRANENDPLAARWVITDALPYPNLPKGYFISMANCEMGGKPDQTLFAAVRYADTEWHKDILWVRKYDLQSGKFAEHSAKNVRCANESWGI